MDQRLKAIDMDRVLLFVVVIIVLPVLSACSGRSVFSGIAGRLGQFENDWVEIPSGAFMMGDEQGDDDEEPVHRVYLDTFWISRFEVTNEAFGRCVEAAVCNDLEEGPIGGPRHPVVHVRWEDARTYCNWIGGRLPTEAEWERSARGGLDRARYPWGDQQVTCEHSALNGAQFGYCQGRSVQVGRFAPNRYGLHDMAGNAWEWVADWYDKDYYQAAPESNPTGPETGRYKVIRGGGWNYSVYGLRIAYRSVALPDSRANFIGFRCVLEGPPG